MNTAGGCPAFFAARLIRASSASVTRNVGVTVRASLGAAGGTIVVAMSDRRTPRGSPQPTPRDTVPGMDPARLAAIAPIVDEPVLRVLAAWPLARGGRCTARDRALGSSELCGWSYSRDRLARLSGVTTLQLERAVDIVASAELVDAATGDVVAEVAALARRELAARLRR